MPTQSVLYNKTILTDAQIKALSTTPIELVEAPGEGKMLIYHSALLSSKIGVGYSYSNRSEDYPDSDIHIAWGGQKYASQNFPFNNLLEGKTDNSIYVVGNSAGINSNTITGMDTNYSQINNKSLDLVVYNTDGDFTGGNVANTIEVTIFYSIVDL